MIWKKIESFFSEDLFPLPVLTLATLVTASGRQFVMSTRVLLINLTIYKLTVYLWLPQLYMYSSSDPYTSSLVSKIDHYLTSKRLQVLHMDKNDYYGGESSSLNLIQVTSLIMVWNLICTNNFEKLITLQSWSWEDCKMRRKWKCGVS